MKEFVVKNKVKLLAAGAMVTAVLAATVCTCANMGVCFSCVLKSIFAF